MFFWIRKDNNGVVFLSIRSFYEINYIQKIEDNLFHIYKPDNSFEELKIVTNYLNPKYKYISTYYKNDDTYVYVNIPSGLKIEEND